MTITKQEIKALKNADKVTFNHYANGKDEICAIQNAQTSSTGFEQTVKIEATSVLADYTGDIKTEYNGSYKYGGFVLLYDGNDVLDTVISMLKEGDSLTMLWIHGNDTDKLRQAGFTVNELKLVINRGGGDKKLTFLIETLTTEINYDWGLVRKAY